MIKIEELKNLVLKDTMIFGAGIMSVGIFIGSTLNYLTQIFLGRFLSVEDYGTFNSLLSLTAILSIPSTVLISSMIKTVAGLRVKNDFKTLTKIFWKTSKYTLLFGFIVAALVLVFRRALFSYLNITHEELIYPFVIYIILLLLSTMPRSYLQGLLRFKAFGFHTVLGPMLKLVMTMVFVILGYRVIGAFFGLATAISVNFLVGIVLLKKNFLSGSSSSLSPYYKKLITFGMAVLLIRISLTVMSNIDLILVKHFFNSADAGIYAGVVTIGKIILFGTGIIGVVMFPIISDLYENGVDYRKKFIFFLFIQILMVSVGVIIFVLYPSFIAYYMFGKAYLPAVAYLAKFSIFAGLFSIVNFIYQFLLAVEKTRSYIILFLGALLQILLINFFHDSLDQIININVAVMLGILVSSLIYLRKFAFN